MNVVIPDAAPVLGRNASLLFATRAVRMFAYGLLSVVLALYLAQLGLSDPQIGLLITLTLVGDVAVSLLLTTHADRWGRRRTLMVGAVLMLLAAVVFATTSSWPVLLVGAIVGVISPGGNEVGPFLPVEQAALAERLAGPRRTSVFAWYNLAGSLATAVGALVGGAVSQTIIAGGWAPVHSYRTVVLLYGVAGLVLALLFTRVTPAVEAAPTPSPQTQRLRPMLGLRRSRGVVLKLSALFALDAFGGGFVVQSLLAYWLHLRFGADPATLGVVFFFANTLAGLSGLAAAALARRFGLINTMVFTHIPSQVLLILVPFMPHLAWAVTLLLLRFSISQMDVPTRQSYTVAVVDPDERSAAQGITGVARSVGAAIPPLFTGLMLASPVLMNMPLLLAGGIKLAYDLLLYRMFRKHRPDHEVKQA